MELVPTLDLGKIFLVSWVKPIIRPATCYRCARHARLSKAISIVDMQTKCVITASVSSVHADIWTDIWLLRFGSLFLALASGFWPQQRCPFETNETPFLKSYFRAFPSIFYCWFFFKSNNFFSCFLDIDMHTSNTVI